ncbi:MAG: cyanophycin synthetase, partial [Bacteroidota bacterium]
MKIRNIQIMRGPNYWSVNRKNLIVVTLDLLELEDRPTSAIEGFYERITTELPSLYSHRCSEGHEGGFFERIKDGTWMGHVLEHVALELQTLAGMDCGFGRTRGTGEHGVYSVIFDYQVEQAGVQAVYEAEKILNAFINNEPVNVQDSIEELEYLKAKHTAGPSTLSIIQEAERRNIPWKRLNNASLVVFGQGTNQKKIRATMTSDTSGIAVDIACNKGETKQILRDAGVPVAKSVIIRSYEELETITDTIPFPFVIKPLDGNHGRGVTINIRTMETAKAAFETAQQISRSVMVEGYVGGYDYRFLVINYKLVAVALRTPAMIIGNGKSTIQELINEANNDPNRGDGHENVLTRIVVDVVTNDILQSKGMNLETVLSFGELLALKNTANLSTGGTATDVTAKVHPQNKFMAERVARLVGLDICGIDVIASDVFEPITSENGAVIEVNACPGFRMHLSPTGGLPINVAAPVVDMMFPDNATGRIPIIAITGTNGKTTTTRLLAHMMAHAGLQPGFTTTDGIYSNGYKIQQGDCTGPQSAQVVLHDPTVNVAVLECARGGILRSGLGFDYCDVSVVTNISEDHLGLKGIHTLDDMARVKSVVARSTAKHGTSVLNADDDNVFAMGEELDCKVALFSMDAQNPRIIEHCRRGGMAAVLENNAFMLIEGKWKTKLTTINKVPLSLGGRAECMIKNVLAAILAAKAHGLDNKTIEGGLASFIPGPAQTPG